MELDARWTRRRVVFLLSEIDGALRPAVAFHEIDQVLVGAREITAESSRGAACRHRARQVQVPDGEAPPPCRDCPW